jgi:hypothetical protein
VLSQTCSTTSSIKRSSRRNKYRVRGLSPLPVVTSECSAVAHFAGELFQILLSLTQRVAEPKVFQPSLSFSRYIISFIIAQLLAALWVSSTTVIDVVFFVFLVLFSFSLAQAVFVLRSTTWALPFADSLSPSLPLSHPQSFPLFIAFKVNYIHEAAGTDCLRRGRGRGFKKKKKHTEKENLVFVCVCVCVRGWVDGSV